MRTTTRRRHLMTAYRSEGDRNIVNDSKAEALEVKGLYRRAATRLIDVMWCCTEDDDRDWVRQRRDDCLQKVRRPPANPDDYGGLQASATRTQDRMGIGRPNGEVFRMKGRKFGILAGNSHSSLYFSDRMLFYSGMKG